MGIFSSLFTFLGPLITFGYLRGAHVSARMPLSTVHTVAIARMPRMTIAVLGAIGIALLYFVGIAMAGRDGPGAGLFLMALLAALGTSAMLIVMPRSALLVNQVAYNSKLAPEKLASFRGRIFGTAREAADPGPTGPDREALGPPPAQVIRAACAGCGQRLSVPTSRGGTVARCPKCGATVTFPKTP